MRCLTLSLDSSLLLTVPSCIPLSEGVGAARHSHRRHRPGKERQRLPGHRNHNTLISRLESLAQCAAELSRMACHPCIVRFLILPLSSPITFVQARAEVPIRVRPLWPLGFAAID
ncbi:hypothetical protein B0H19DRAFT_1144362 [Mycena capillaripes]|nr:hypothetical protein B0H19DRAFT_1144362 [Mycena capillaripes]